MAKPEGHVDHPSGGHYHPDHIQTPKEYPLPVAVVEELEAAVQGAVEAVEEVLAERAAERPATSKPHVFGTI